MQATNALGKNAINRIRRVWKMARTRRRINCWGTVTFRFFFFFSIIRLLHLYVTLWIVSSRILMNGSSQGILMKTNEEGLKTLEKLTSTEDIQRVAPLPSSDAKSTIVMEVSTIQKFMQVLDSDRDTQQSSRRPKGTLTYRISPETERKVQLIVEDDSAHKMGSMKKEWSIRSPTLSWIDFWKTNKCSRNIVTLVIL